MGDWGDDALREWSRDAAARTGERLNALEYGPPSSAEMDGHAAGEGNNPDHRRDSASPATIPGEANAGAPPQLEDADVNDEIRPVPVFGVLTEPESTGRAPKRGLWEVVTEASKYYLDLDREMLQRVRGTVKPAPDVAFPSKLRDHDRGWVRLLRIVQLEVGEPAVFDIESLGGPEMLFTRRTTTFVLSIRQLGGDEPFG